MSKTMQGVHCLHAHMSCEVSLLEVAVVCATDNHGCDDCVRREGLDGRIEGRRWRGG